MVLSGLWINDAGRGRQQLSAPAIRRVEPPRYPPPQSVITRRSPPTGWNGRRETRKGWNKSPEGAPMSKHRRTRHQESAYIERVRRVIEKMPNPTLDELLAQGKESGRRRRRTR